MLELPEAFTIARQFNELLIGRRITSVTAAHCPHKFAWYYGGPQEYNARLNGKAFDHASACGGLIEITSGDTVLLVGDGVGLRLHGVTEPRPVRHQLLIEFESGEALSASIAMYGGIWCFQRGEFDSQVYKAAREKPSPLSATFDETYFEALLRSCKLDKLSIKAFLATEQRIPGLGNGVLQDILWVAGIHPKQKMSALKDAELITLLKTIKSQLTCMTESGGRDTEKDLYGQKGGYQTVMSKNNDGMPCPRCGAFIKKEAYMGGSIYTCTGCQRF